MDPLFLPVLWVMWNELWVKRYRLVRITNFTSLINSLHQAHQVWPERPGLSPPF
jgi:hypothetical protein